MIRAWRATTIQVEAQRPEGRVPDCRALWVLFPSRVFPLCDRFVACLLLINIFFISLKKVIIKIYTIRTKLTRRSDITADIEKEKTLTCVHVAAVKTAADLHKKPGEVPCGDPDVHRCGIMYMLGYT